jgi:hypothetical protein
LIFATITSCAVALCSSYREPEWKLRTAYERSNSQVKRGMFQEPNCSDLPK